MQREWNTDITQAPEGLSSPFWAKVEMDDGTIDVLLATMSSEYHEFSGTYRYVVTDLAGDRPWNKTLAWMELEDAPDAA